MEFKIDGHTRLGGLLGSPVSHSISPMMHNDSFALLGLNQVYLCFDVVPENLPETVKGLRNMNVYGFNLTMPDKQAIIPCLDELSLAASLVGAVNTVVNQDGRLIGHNTDGYGFMESLRQTGCDPAGKEMTLIGAGGAASAIAAQAAIDGVTKLHLVSRRGRSWDHARALVDSIGERTACEAKLIDLADLEAVRRSVSTSYVLVNGTSAGMAPREELTPLEDTSVFREGLVVADVIYNPRETRFLREAAQHGCKTMNGLYMLLYQGAEAFRLWTGQDMPVEQIKARYFS